MADLDNIKNSPTPKTRIVRATRLRPRRILPGGRVSFPKQLDLLRAAAAASGQERRPISNEDIAKIVGIYLGTVSNCNPFFQDTGLFLKSKLQNVPCEEVFAYAERFEWEPEKAALKLGPVIRKTWFAIALLPKLTFRSLSIDEVVNTLASEASASPEYKDQLGMLIDFMRVSGLISVENGVVSLNKGSVEEEQVAEYQQPTSLVTEEKPLTQKIFAPSSKKAEDEFERHPFISGLLRTLPEPGEDWSITKRIKWLQAASNIFGLIYTTQDGDENEFISIEKKTG